jgi:hypothetical protein
MKYLYIALFLSCFQWSNAQNVNIPDSTFKAYLVGHTGVNTNGDAEIQQSEANAYTGQLLCHGMNISDLTGIEAFTAMTYLSCWGNSLTTLNLSQNTALTYLHCANNNLTSLDVSNLLALTHLVFTNNQIDSIDVSFNPNLYLFGCANNLLTSIDVSNNSALEIFNCGSNQISSIDLSQNSALVSLICDQNLLTHLDLSQNPLLVSLDFSYNELDSIDLSLNTHLRNLKFRSNNVLNLDLSQNPSLSLLWCDGNNLTSLDVSQNDSIVELWCHGNQITDLDLSGHPLLTEFMCSNNNLVSLNVANGNNQNIGGGDFRAVVNPNLSCIQVDDAVWSTTNWTFIDSTATFSENCSGTTSTNALDLSSEIKIFPNPTTAFIQIESPINIDFVQIYSADGKLMRIVENRNQIDLSTYAKGFYLLKVQTAHGVSTHKIIKQ